MNKIAILIIIVIAMIICGTVLILNNKNESDTNENKLDTSVELDEQQLANDDIKPIENVDDLTHVNVSNNTTHNYINELTNQDIEKIMQWNFDDNKIVSLEWLSEQLFDVYDDYNPYGYFSDDGKSFINIDDNGNETVSKYVDVHFDPELRGTIKATSGFGYDNYMGLLLTSNGDLYIGNLIGPGEIGPDFKMTVSFIKYETPNEVVGLNRNIVKYADNSFGFLDFTVDYYELQQTTATPFEEMYKITKLTSDNLSNEIVFRLLNGAYIVDCIKNPSGDICELSDINISSVEYLICGSLSVYGFDNPYYIGLQFKYNDGDGKEQVLDALYNDIYNDVSPIKAFVDVNQDRIIIDGSSLIKEVEYSFEVNNEEVNNIRLIIYLHDGHVIEAHFEESIDTFRNRYEDYSANKSINLYEVASYGANYYEYFKRDVSDLLLKY